MITNLSGTDIIIILAVLSGIYYWIVLRGQRKAITSTAGRGEFQSLQFSQVANTAFPQLIDKPIDHPTGTLSISLEQQIEEDAQLEMLEDADSTLLKEAENVVTQVQDVVSHIASSPPNPEEVYTKLKAVVSQYKLFENTEYYDAINSFILVTIERDCAIQFSKEEILQLWG
jgi:hypothetical protein